MNKIILKLGSIIKKVLPYDKSLHFIFGGFIMFFASLLNFIAGGPIGISITLSVFATFLVAFLKEYMIDRKIKGEEPDFLDILATVIGGLWIGIVEIVMYYIHETIVVY